MEITPIRSDADYEAALTEIERLWKSRPGTLEGDKLDVLIALVKVYEDREFPIAEADPVQIIEAVMEQRGATRTELGKVLGAPARTSDILKRRRPLTLAMIRRLSKEWHIPAAALIAEYEIKAA